jgi:hypothetical protein
MGSITTEYRGHEIRYDQNADEWTSYDLAGKTKSSPSLSKIKAAIDAMYLAERKANATACLEVRNHTSLKVVDATLVEYLGPTIERSLHSQMRRISDHKVASVARREGSSKPSRCEMPLSCFAPLSPETDAALVRVREAETVLRRAQKAYKDAVAAIPRVTLDDIADLVRLSGIDPTGGIKEGGKK